MSLNCLYNSNLAVLSPTPWDRFNQLTYQGCNGEDIGEGIEIPRTLYYLFFTYFSLKEVIIDKTRYPILRCPIAFNDEKPLEVSRPKARMEQIKSDCEISQASLSQDIRSYFVTHGIDNPQTCRGEEIVKIVNQLWKDCDQIELKYCELNRKDELDESQSPYDHCFVYNFVRFIHSGRDNSKLLLLSAIKEEWSLPRQVTILYRSADLSKDHVLKENQTKWHSLSFGTSLLSGIVFEGGSAGTCPLSFQNYSKQGLYGLKLSQNKLNRYFYCPEVLKKGLISLVSQREFSHPRLKIYDPSANDPISGVQGRSDAVKKVAAIYPGDLPKMATRDKYLEKVTKIYNRNLILIS